MQTPVFTLANDKGSCRDSTTLFIESLLREPSDMSAERPLKSHKLRSVWLILVLLAVGTILLFWGGLDNTAPRSSKQLWNIGHILYFALATYLLIGWKPFAHLAVPWRWLLVLCIALIAGLSIEIMQYGTRRNPDMGDVYRDMIGTILVLCFGPGHNQIKTRLYRTMLQSLAVILLLIQLWPLLLALIDEVIAWRQFPMLSSFETPFELTRWEGNAELEIVEPSFSTTGKMLKMNLTRANYSGIRLKYFNRDWEAFDSLSMNLYNPLSEPIWITCRIHDLEHEKGEQQYHDRFNQRFLIGSGWNPIEISLAGVGAAPRNRRLDLSRIGNLGIFVTAINKQRVLFLDEVRLHHSHTGSNR